jgi:hypothetical protein
MKTYSVKGDVLNNYRWVVEIEHNRIVALAKLQQDPDGGRDIITKALLKEKVMGKTPKQVQAQDYFKKPVLVLRSRTTGKMIHVYDVRSVVDLLGAKYCVLEFNKANRCDNIRLVGIPASTAKSKV